MSDCRAMAQIHADALSGGFLAQLGPDILQACYRAWTTDPSAITLVALDPYKPIAMLVASLDPVASRQYLLKTSRWTILFELLKQLARPKRLWQCVETYRAGAGSTPPLSGRPQTEILVLAVASPWRGMGIGYQLIEAFRHVLHHRGHAKQFSVVVGNALPAKAFYERVGGTLVQTVRVHSNAPLSSVYLFDLTTKDSPS